MAIAKEIAPMIVAKALATFALEMGFALRMGNALEVNAGRNQWLLFSADFISKMFDDNAMLRQRRSARASTLWK